MHLLSVAAKCAGPPAPPDHTHTLPPFRPVRPALQEHALQAQEDVLPYEAFSIRLTNDDLPHLRETLRGISDEQYRSLLEGVRRYMPAFSWDDAAGGRAFDFTIASLRRRHLNFKALYYNAVAAQL